VTPGEALLILSASCDAMWNGRLDSWASAGEISSQLDRGYGRGDAQRMGAKLAALERRGLFESKPEPWGKSWRPAPAVCALLETLS
jgi:hypothetical protein